MSKKSSPKSVPSLTNMPKITKNVKLRVRFISVWDWSDTVFNIKLN